MSKIKNHYATELEEAHAMIEGLVEAAKSLLYELQPVVMPRDCFEPMKMLMQAIAKAEGK